MPKYFSTKNSLTSVSQSYQPYCLVYQFQSFEEASNFIAVWFKELKHNPTEFTQDLPALLDGACDYREEIIKKSQASNPEQPLDGINDLTILMKCIKDFGEFKQPNESVCIPTKDDYLFHFTLKLLEHCCVNDRIQNIIPRVIMNNLAIKLS